MWCVSNIILHQLLHLSFSFHCLLNTACLVAHSAVICRWYWGAAAAFGYSSSSACCWCPNSLWRVHLLPSVLSSSAYQPNLLVVNFFFFFCLCIHIHSSYLNQTSVIFFSKWICKLINYKLVLIYYNQKWLCGSNSSDHTVPQIQPCPEFSSLKVLGQPTFGTILSVDTDYWCLFILS